MADDAADGEARLRRHFLNRLPGGFVPGGGHAQRGGSAFAAAEGFSIQHDAFSNLEMGLGTAQSLVLFLLLLGLMGWMLNNYRKMYGV